MSSSTNSNFMLLDKFHQAPDFYHLYYQRLESFVTPISPDYPTSTMHSYTEPTILRTQPNIDYFEEIISTNIFSAELFKPLKQFLSEMNESPEPYFTPVIFQNFRDYHGRYYIAVAYRPSFSFFKFRSDKPENKSIKLALDTLTPSYTALNPKQELIDELVSYIQASNIIYKDYIIAGLTQTDFPDNLPVDNIPFNPVQEELYKDYINNFSSILPEYYEYQSKAQRFAFLPVHPSGDRTINFIIKLAAIQNHAGLTNQVFRGIDFVQNFANDKISLTEFLDEIQHFLTPIDNSTDDYQTELLVKISQKLVEVFDNLVSNYKEKYVESNLLTSDDLQDPIDYIMNLRRGYLGAGTTSAYYPKN